MLVYSILIYCFLLPEVVRFRATAFASNGNLIKRRFEFEYQNELRRGAYYKVAEFGGRMHEALRQWVGRYPGLDFTAPFSGLHEVLAADQLPPLHLYLEPLHNSGVVITKTDAVRILADIRERLPRGPDRGATRLTVNGIRWHVYLQGRPDSPPVARGAAFGNPIFNGVASFDYVPGRVYPVRDLARALVKAASSLDSDQWGLLQPVNTLDSFTVYPTTGLRAFHIFVELQEQQYVDHRRDLMRLTLRDALMAAAPELVRRSRDESLSGFTFQIDQWMRDDRWPYDGRVISIAKVHGAEVFPGLAHAKPGSNATVLSTDPALATNWTFRTSTQ